MVSTQKIEHTLPLTKPLVTVVNIGSTFGTPVNDKEYQIPFRSTGKIDKITFALDPPGLTPSDVQKF